MNLTAFFGEFYFLFIFVHEFQIFTNKIKISYYISDMTKNDANRIIIYAKKSHLNYCPKRTMSRARYLTIYVI